MTRRHLLLGIPIHGSTYIVNDKMEKISGIKKLLKPEYGNGVIYPNGEPAVNWKLLSHYADKDGFDIRNVEKNGKYKNEIELPYGTIIIRYGNETGRFSAPKGTKYEDLALPYIKDTVEYNEYKVVAEVIKVRCIVNSGKVAPGFGSEGGAVQYLHPITIRQSVESKLLERIGLQCLMQN